MFQFILANVAMISAGVILYLVARALPRLDGEEVRKPTFLERWIMSDMPAKLDRVARIYAEKFFRRFKVYVMRLDNFLTYKLKQMNGENCGLAGQPKPRIDLKEIAAEKNGDRSEEDGGSNSP